MAAHVLAGDGGRDAHAGQIATVRANDTIVALSSGQLPAAIGIVRMSGPGAFAALQKLVRSLPPPRHAAVRVLRWADTGAMIDRALVIIFPGPESATGEDVAEIHAHGGPAVVAKLVEAVINAGARLAEPGEFTRRAFEHGLIDLTQAEGLADLLAATTEAQRAQAALQAEGGLREHAEQWQARLIALLASANAAIDFADEAEGAAAFVSRDAIRVLRDEIAAVQASAMRGDKLRSGLVVALIGEVNVGKSSLLNALAGRDAAIVSPQPGTTRDPVEVALVLGGIPLTIVDTAGLREADDAVEAEGIARTRQRAASADLVLHLSETVPNVSLGTIILTKSDLHPPHAAGYLHVSAHTGDGLAKLLDWLTDWARAVVRPGEPALVTNVRHADLLGRLISDLSDALACTEDVLLAEAVGSAAAGLHRLTGRGGVEEMLGAIFARFCIGK